MLNIEFQKKQAERGEIAESTINNYYKSVKLFCEMNDPVLIGAITLERKRICY
jgi:hypothetical protein